jgi:hypothetical protein
VVRTFALIPYRFIRAKRWFGKSESPKPLMRADGRIEIIVDGARPRYDKGFVGAGWRARHLIDATGRASVTAQARVRSRPGWASRFFWTARRSTRATPEFRIAALSCGYAYRLGSAATSVSA